jgi:hypothetical protein
MGLTGVLTPGGSSLGGDSHSSPRRFLFSSYSRTVSGCPTLYQTLSSSVSGPSLTPSETGLDPSSAAIFQWRLGSQWPARVVSLFAATDNI